MLIETGPIQKCNTGVLTHTRFAPPPKTHRTDRQAGVEFEGRSVITAKRAITVEREEVKKNSEY